MLFAAYGAVISLIEQGTDNEETRLLKTLLELLLSFAR